MLIVDTPISREYWQPTLEMLQDLVHRHGAVKKRAGLYCITDGDTKIYFLATWKRSCFFVKGWLLLTRKPGWVAWEIAQVVVFQLFRGKGLGTSLYDAAINDGLVLAAGTQQTHHARDLWKTFVRTRRYNIWAHDFKNLNSFADVVYDADEDSLWCHLPLYYKWKRYDKRDIRLVATRKTNDCKS